MIFQILHVDGKHDERYNKNYRFKLVLSWSLWQRNGVFLVYWMTISFLSAVSLHGTSTESIHYPKSLCVVAELKDIGIITGATPLALTTKKLFQWVLAKIIT